MASRTVVPIDNNYIYKTILFSPKDNCPLPTYDLIYASYTSEQLTKTLQDHGADKIIQNALIQQWNEMRLYEITSNEEKNLLAPQVKWIKNKYNIYSITYPRFRPIFNSEEVYNYNNENLKYLTGHRVAELGGNEKDLLNFLERAYQLCQTYNLNSDDILNNPSNIGYHPILGLRIIDYGMAGNFGLIDDI